MPHNIEKSAFTRLEYVGYRNGVWRICKRAGQWVATRDEYTLYAATLKKLSVVLSHHPY